MVSSSSIVALNIVTILTFAVLPLEHIRLALTLFLTMLIVELLQDILNLALELVVDLIHKVLQHFWHTQLFCLFAKLLAGKDRVESTVDICSYLRVLMFD